MARASLRYRWQHHIGRTVRPPYTQPQIGAWLMLAIVVVIAIMFSR